MDSFLHHVTTANFKTPGSSPRCPRPPLPPARLLPSPEKGAEWPGPGGQGAGGPGGQGAGEGRKGGPAGAGEVRGGS